MKEINATLKFAYPPCYCGGGSIEHVYHQTRHRDVIPICRCSNCKTIFLPFYLTDESLSYYYSEIYRKVKHSDETPESLFHRQAKRGEVLKKLYDSYERSGKKLSILDYGGASGGVVSAFDNCDRFVFDFDEKFTDYASSVGIKVIDSLTDPTLAGKFDVIILSHVIEHLAKPTEVLEQLKTVLKDDGLILIATTFAETSILRHKIISFLPDIHLAHKYYFTRYSLSRMMRSINLFPVVAEKDWLFFSLNQRQAINIRKSLYDTKISKLLVKLNIGIPLYVRKFVSKYIKR